MRIAIFEVEPWERPAFQKLLAEHELSLTDKPLTAETVGEFSDAAIVSTFIYSKLDAEVLGRLPRLEMVATRSTGVDHIDHRYCREHGIVVCNVPTYGESTVAEHVFALLLTISHRMWDAIDRTRKGDFSLQGLCGFDLRGKTLAVIGTGAIGRHVIRIARGFAMEVVGFDPRPAPDLAAEPGFRYLPVEECLARADVISLHVPLNAATRHMISRAEFARMKPGAVLINTARGDVVDVKAMIEALAEGKLAAVGLDVLPEEPIIREEAELLRSVFRRDRNQEALLADHVLLRLRNVFVTPHSAFHTREAIERILETTVENITGFCRGQPQNTVRPPGAAAMA